MLNASMKRKATLNLQGAVISSISLIQQLISEDLLCYITLLSLGKEVKTEVLSSSSLEHAAQ
jgi:hypothetical protein